MCPVSHLIEEFAKTRECSSAPCFSLAIAHLQTHETLPAVFIYLPEETVDCAGSEELLLIMASVWLIG